jgi:hypothetical protein
MPTSASSPRVSGVLARLASAVVGCDCGGDGDSAHDANPSVDAAAEDTLTMDSPPDVPMDTASAQDAPRDSERDHEAFACAYMLGAAAPCNGMSQSYCVAWAGRVGASWIEPTATCVQGSEGSGCIGADTCDSIFDVTTCHCGLGPPCEDGNVCARPAPGAARQCVPCSSDR